MGASEVSVANEGDLGLSPGTILELPLESLALVVLENYVSSGGWNRGNWLLGAQSFLGNGMHMDALAEAWAWLEARALVAPSPGKRDSDARIVTRAGRAAVSQGSLDEIKAAER